MATPLPGLLKLPRAERVRYRNLRPPGQGVENDREGALCLLRSSAEPHHRVQVPEHVVDLLAWPAVDEVHVAAEPEFLAALHYAQHVRDTALRVGTLSGILGDVAAHLRSTRDALVERLFGP